MRAAGLFEQRDELTQPRLREMTELAGMTAANRIVEILQELQSGVGHADLDDTAVFSRAFPTNQLAMLQFIEHAGDIRCPRDEPLGQGQSRQTCRVFASEESQCVVLLGRQIDGIEESILLGPQTVVRSPEVEIRLLFQRIESPGFNRRRHIGRDARSHACNIFV